MTVDPSQAPYGTPDLQPAPLAVGGVPEAVPEFEDYFAFSDVKTFTLPDGKQWIKFAVMDEGAKAKFQRMTNRDITMNQKTNEAKIRADVANDRHELIKLSVVDWYMLWRDPASGSVIPVPFSKSDARLHPSGMNLEKFLSGANPKIIEDLEYAIRMANPWMQGDMSIKDIDEEITRLRELRETKEREEAGNS